MNAARFIGATFHGSLVKDIDIFYEKKLLARMGSIMREVAPEIVLTHSPQEYMEDHSSTCRLVVSAAFTRGMRNFPVRPPRPAVEQAVSVYHAMPYGLRDPLRRKVKPGMFVDVTTVLTAKREMLALHRSQKEWLDASQGVDSYLITMEEMSREVGRMSRRFRYAEGWVRHSPLGFCAEDANPLAAALGHKCHIVRSFETSLG